MSSLASGPETFQGDQQTRFKKHSSFIDFSFDLSATTTLAVVDVLNGPDVVSSRRRDAVVMKRCRHLYTPNIEIHVCTTIDQRL